MFTGIINHIGLVESAQQVGELTLTITCDWPEESLAIGESIACNGACLTITGRGKNILGKSFFTAQLSRETLARTAGRWDVGNAINLERALKVGDTLDGHMVTGHVDGVALVHSIKIQGDSHILALDVPEKLAPFIAEKGSVTLDGISLTVNQVEGSRFWVNIIPHTWETTTLKLRKERDSLNIEVDTIARYVARFLTAQVPNTQARP